MREHFLGGKAVHDAQTITASTLSRRADCHPLAGALAILSTWVPVGATGAPGDKDRDDAQALQIVLIEDRGSGLPWPVQGRRFNVVVQAVDDDGEPTEVHEPTKIKLIEVSGPGRLGGNTTAVIPERLL